MFFLTLSAFYFYAVMATGLDPRQLILSGVFLFSPISTWWQLTQK